MKGRAMQWRSLSKAIISIGRLCRARPVHQATSVPPLDVWGERINLEQRST